jgi:hypothetical protein
LQRVIEFKKLSFWTSRPDLAQLNEQILQLNKDGWRVVTIAPNCTMLGLVTSYTLLLEKK